jgi:hypothetical protein
MKGLRDLPGLAGIAAERCSSLAACWRLRFPQCRYLSIGDGRRLAARRRRPERERRSPGLGAWTVDISFDSSVVTVVTCSPQQGGVCNPNFATDTIRSPRQRKRPVGRYHAGHGHVRCGS